MMTRARLIVAALVVTSLVLPAAALAGNTPSNPAGEAGGSQGSIESAGGALPFTGLNLVLILVGGVVLIASGILLRRRSQAHTD